MTVMDSEQTNSPHGLVDDWLATLNVETGLYVLIGLLAFAIRYNLLGAAPLSTVEAREALSAARLVSMSSLPVLQPVSAAWYTLTSLTFLLLGSNEFLARFWPMLAGVALVFTPLIFRRELGRSGALVASALLAVSPTLMAASRMADGTTLAALGLVLAVAGLRRQAEFPTGRSWILTGLGLGLALASGPHFISGVLAGLIALLVVVFIKPTAARTLRSGWALVRPQLGKTLVVTAGAFILAASGGLLIPSGLSAAGAALPLWLAGWAANTESRPIWLIPQLIFANEPLLTLLGLVGFYIAFLSGYFTAIAARLRLIFTAQSDSEIDAGLQPAPVLPWLNTAATLSATTLGGLLFCMIYVGRSASDALWVVLPLSMLAGKVIVETFAGDWFEGEWETVAAQAGVLFVMIVFAYFNLAAYGKGAILFLDRPLELRLYLAGAVLALGIFVTVMFGLGWSTLSAMRGALLAVGLALLLGTVSSGLGLTQWRSSDPNELWVSNPTNPDIALLRQTLHATSQRSTGQTDQLEVAVVSDPIRDDRNSLLGWELRGFPNAKFVDSLDLAIGSPTIIVDSAVTDPRLDSGYTGEKFPLMSRQLQTDSTLQAYVNWWLYRDWPTEFSRTVTVWERADVHNLLKQP